MSGVPCKMRRSEQRAAMWEIILVGHKTKSRAERPLLSSLAHALLWDAQLPLIEENKSRFSFSFPAVTFHHSQNPHKEEAMRGLIRDPEFLEVS